MEIKKICLEFTDEEIEAICYALELGIRSYKKNVPKCADDWIKTAEEVMRMLPTKLHLQDLRKS
jgi:hypothetical protein